MLPQKHREASKFKYNSGFYITTNVYPDFGDGLDGEAIKKRLKVFQTKSLKRKDLTVTGNCFSCFRFVYQPSFLILRQWVDED